MLYQEVIEFDTDMINRVGGCTPKCLRDEYSVRHFQTSACTTMCEDDPDSWTVELFFGKDRFHLRQQYYTYDFPNLLADFGGYLGLLLGSSIMGFYDTLVDLVRKLFGKSKKDNVKAAQRSLRSR